MIERAKLDENTPLASHRIMDYAKIHRDMMKSMEIILPQSSDETRRKVIEGFVEKGTTQAGFQSFFKRSLLLSESEKNRFQSMADHGFEPEQLLLFVQSDPKERKRLEEAWFKSLGKQGKEVIEQGFARSGPITNAILIGVGTASLGSMAIGAAIGQQDIVDIGRELANQMPGALGDIANGVNVAMEGMSPATLGAVVALLGRAVPFALKEIIRSPIENKINDTQQLLIDRVHGVFSRAGDAAFEMPGQAVSEVQSLQELAAIPATHQPLLTHLRPHELISFLNADDQARTTMMKTNPPGYEQRVDTVRAINPGRFNEFKSAMMQAVSSWEGKLQDAGAVTLKKTMQTLLSERALARQQEGGLPPERPRLTAPKMG